VTQNRLPETESDASKMRMQEELETEPKTSGKLRKQTSNSTRVYIE